jgi:hypothetical protein
MIYSKQTTFLFRTHLRQFCSLSVPSLLAPGSTPGLSQESEASFRLVYELVLPYLLPLVFLGFPYITLLIGLMRSVPAANHSEHATKGGDSQTFISLSLIWVNLV